MFGSFVWRLRCGASSHCFVTLKRRLLARSRRCNCDTPSSYCVPEPSHKLACIRASTWQYGTSLVCTRVYVISTANGSVVPRRRTTLPFDDEPHCHSKHKSCSHSTRAPRALPNYVPEPIAIGESPSFSAFPSRDPSSAPWHGLHCTDHDVVVIHTSPNAIIIIMIRSI